ncbi:MAG TPA: PAS domain-containing protein, partial [Candidatus Kapabacteria bacterium]|nr:PAS domain-containing protein [Candidatus Kapabacteria bacterium]
FMHGNVEEITGYDADDFLTNQVHWDNIVLEEDLQIVRQNREFIRNHPNKSVEFEYRIINKNGNICWLNESLLNVTNEKKEIIYIQATIYDITQRKIAETELRESRQQLRNLALHLDSVREEERKQIAFEIHDELGYALTAIKLDIAWLMKKIDVSKDNLEQKIKEMSDLLELTIQKVRTISSQLRPSILDHFGLVAAIDWQSKEFQRRTAIRTRFFVNPRDLTVPENLATPIFRIFQESLTNISRYAKASRVDVSMEIVDSNLVLKVVDNGLGIEPEKIYHKNSFGLLGMREKAKSMGGALVINNLKYKNNGYQDNDEIHGTEVILSVPIKVEVKND